MGDDLGVSLGGERDPFFFQLVPQFPEILDDAVVHDGKPVGGVGMGVVFGRPTVRCPARVADPDGSRKRLAHEPLFQVLELALGATPRQRAVLQRRHARRIVAAVFETLERFDEKRCDRLAADDADNPAHP